MTLITTIRSAARPARILLTATVLATVLFVGAVASAQAATFDPAKFISDDNFRAYDSMNQADIQAFLKSSPVLASYMATDYASGKKVAASVIIYNAAQKFHINPRVILTLLQKEQSLLTRSKSGLVTGNHATVDWALGMGCPDGYSSCIKSGCHASKPSDNRYPEYRGFGKQIWAACMSLDAYGEKGKTRPGWHHTKTPPVESANWKVGTVFKGLYVPGGTKDVAIQNLASFKLYTYNPSIGAKSPYGDLSSQSSNLSGNSNFWWIYRKNFGDTFANPRMRLVFRLRNIKSGAYLFTTSPAERYNLTRSGAYKYEKVAFSINSSNTANSVPVFRFMNRKTRAYTFAVTRAQYNLLRSSAKSKTWRYEGVAFKVAAKAATSTPVYQYNNKKTGLPFFTPSTAEKNTFSTSAYRKKWTYKGVAFYLAP